MSRRSLLLLLLMLASAASPLAAATDGRVLNALIDGVFAAHVDDGYVDYPAIARNVRFHKYLEAIAAFDADTLGSREEQLAFWINAYNACVIQQIIEGQSPIGTFARIKFFRTTGHEVGGRKLDLNAMANDILYPLDEPRVHFALVNSAYSAPRLPSRAYRADELEQQLEANTRDFINDNRKNRFSAQLRRASVSQIFDEHAAAFGGTKDAVLAFLSRYVAEREVASGLAEGTYTLDYLEYDWSINGRPMGPVTE